MANSWKFMFINIRGAKNILLNFELNFFIISRGATLLYFLNSAQRI